MPTQLKSQFWRPPFHVKSQFPRPPFGEGRLVLKPLGSNKQPFLRVYGFRFWGHTPLPFPNVSTPPPPPGSWHHYRNVECPHIFVLCGQVYELTRELKLYKWDVAGLPEMRWTGFMRKTRNKDIKYVAFWRRNQGNQGNQLLAVSSAVPLSQADLSPNALQPNLSYSATPKYVLMYNQDSYDRTSMLFGIGET